jgi:uncharacterized protein (DUF362 family)
MKPVFVVPERVVGVEGNGVEVGELKHWGSGLGVRYQTSG